VTFEFLVIYEIASAVNAAETYMVETTVNELAIIRSSVDPRFKPTKIPPNPQRSSATDKWILKRRLNRSFRLMKPKGIPMYNAPIILLAMRPESKAACSGYADRVEKIAEERERDSISG
jgi:hypothetical protein